MQQDDLSADMRGHLESLVGRTIETISGRPNSVLALTSDSVIVGTAKSPGGKPVPLAQVQDAANRLFAGEEVSINPKSVGYRSAFIGAALKSLPGTEVLLDPQRVRLTKR